MPFPRFRLAQCQAGVATFVADQPGGDQIGLHHVEHVHEFADLVIAQTLKKNAFHGDGVGSQRFGDVARFVGEHDFLQPRVPRHGFAHDKPFAFHQCEHSARRRPGDAEAAFHILREDLLFRMAREEGDDVDVATAQTLQILKFKGIDNINDIEKYKGKSLYVTREHAVKLKKDEYFIADLIDMQVELEDGTAFGVLTDVMQTGANDVYCIRTEEHGEVLIPAIKDCILDVDVEAGKMKIHLLDGLI